MERHVLINKLHLNISANLTHPFSPKYAQIIFMNRIVMN